MVSYSVIIPTRNAESTLEETLKSIKQAQLRAHLPESSLEVIIVDSSSYDGTKSIANSFSSELSVLFFDIGTSSIGGARNYGTDRAKGEYLIYLDSDDSLTSHRFVQDQLALGIGGFRYVYGSVFQNNIDAPCLNYLSLPSTEHLLNMPIALSALTISSKYLSDYSYRFTDGPHGRYGEDWEFVLQIISSRKTLEMPYYLPRSIINQRSDSHTTSVADCKLACVTFAFLITHMKRSRDSRPISYCYLFLYLCKTIFRLTRSMIKSQTALKTATRELRKILYQDKKTTFILLAASPFLAPIALYSQLFKHRHSVFSPFHKNQKFIYSL